MKDIVKYLDSNDKNSKELIDANLNRMSELIMLKLEFFRIFDKEEGNNDKRK